MEFALGALAGILIAFLTGQVFMNDLSSGIAPGLIAFLWVSFSARESSAPPQSDLLHPPEREFSMTASELGERLCSVLKESAYSDEGWKVVRSGSDSECIEGRIKLRGYEKDEESVMLTAFIRSGSPAALQLEWLPLSDEVSTHCMVLLIHETELSLRRILGEEISAKPVAYKWIPPSWLHAVTLILAIIYGSNCALMLGERRPPTIEPEQITESMVKAKSESLQRLKQAASDWKEFQSSASASFGGG